MLLEITAFTLFIVPGNAIYKSPAIEVAKLGSLAKSALLQVQSLAFRQQVEANYAAFLLKNDLAQSAVNAASAAQAAVASKKLAVDALRKQLKEAEEVLDAEISQYEPLKEVAEIFSKVAQDSQSQIDTLGEILERAKNKTRKEITAGISFGAGFH